jgi:8-oxo-dGTP pyrophosphatase MutT (NUDIX family)
MLVRPARETGFEVFMLRRSEASHFVPDVYVFPGGTLDQSDCSERALARARGIDDDSLARQFRAKDAPGLPSPFGVPPRREAAGLLIAGVRELYEEAGVLLACNASGTPLSDEYLAPHRSLLHECRARVQSGEMQFAEALEGIDGYANTAALTLFSHWITPPGFPQRYDAHFFVAQASPDQAAVADSIETHDGVWLGAADALEQSALGAFRMVYPTIKHVERLAQFRTVEQLLAFARTKPVYSIMPNMPGAKHFTIPSDLEFRW